MIVISSQTAGGGSVTFTSPLSDEPDRREARISRSKTLDGGCVIVHQGTTDADRTIKITERLSSADRATVLGWYEDAEALSVSTRDGLYSAFISQFFDDRGKIELTILIKEKIA